ncbi:Dnaj-like Subfamily C Member 11 [Manis pentadactyla]|nr:Dnaj-like Subfamily C Member 11 [Manis pentadactyla]
MVDQIYGEAWVTSMVQVYMEDRFKDRVRTRIELGFNSDVRDYSEATVMSKLTVEGQAIGVGIDGDHEGYGSSPQQGLGLGIREWKEKQYGICSSFFQLIVLTDDLSLEREQPAKLLYEHFLYEGIMR